jgi:hypothetical protein
METFCAHRREAWVLAGKQLPQAVSPQVNLLYNNARKNAEKRQEDLFLHRGASWLFIR